MLPHDAALRCNAVAYFPTPPIAIVDHPADAQHKGGARHGYKWIVIHSTGGTNSLAWLSTTSSPPVSIHRLINKQGTVYKIVPDDQVAWHAGPAQVGRLPSATENMNNVSLGIELENLNDGVDPYPHAQIISCVAQVLEWKGQFGDLPVVSHAAIQANKVDPRGFPWETFWHAYFDRLKELL